MRNSIVIIGAGGHGRVCAEIASAMGYQKIQFLDDQPQGKSNVVGTTEDLALYSETSDFFVALGSKLLRSVFFEKIRAVNGTFATLIHPNSVVSKTAVIGEGSVVMAGTVINAGANIGRGVIINTCSSVDHDCVIGDFCHIAVGAHLAGTVAIGAQTLIGAGAVVINNLTVAADVTVGAGAAVIGHITEAGTYVGVPARKVN